MVAVVGLVGHFELVEVGESRQLPAFRVAIDDEARVVTPIACPVSRLTTVEQQRHLGQLILGIAPNGHDSF